VLEEGIALQDMSVSFPGRVPEELPGPLQTTPGPSHPGWTCRSWRARMQPVWFLPMECHLWDTFWHWLTAKEEARCESPVP